MSLSAKDAAAAVGLTKQAILKAVKTGKLSATKDARGQWIIEPVELFRVYQPVEDTHPATDTHPDTVGLQVENRLLRERLADKDSVIEDLRSRLDSESEERRRLARLLTDSKPRRSWWARLWGGS
jgi:hypothetical protein